MIKAILVVNNHGQARLVKFYEQYDEALKQQLVREAFVAVSKRSDTVCNFLELASDCWGKDVKLIYRHYATLYFIYVVDRAESELGILDLIQVFVEALDRCFENVCELDLIFHQDKVNYLIDEIVMGGLVLETGVNSLLEAYDGVSRGGEQTGPNQVAQAASKVVNLAKSVGRDQSGGHTL